MLNTLLFHDTQTFHTPKISLLKLTAIILSTFVLLNTPPLYAASTVTSTANTSNAATTTLSSASETEKLKEKNLMDGKAFLEQNQKKPDVITLPTGLQFKVIQEGAGDPPGPIDMVTVHYRGTLIDGTEFDSSYKRGEPSTFAINAIIPGWSEALQLMKPGAKWTLYIPPELAYGERGVGRTIGPNSVLIFDVELISFKQPEENEDRLRDEAEDG